MGALPVASTLTSLGSSSSSSPNVARTVPFGGDRGNIQPFQKGSSTSFHYLEISGTVTHGGDSGSTLTPFSKALPVAPPWNGRQGQSTQIVRTNWQMACFSLIVALKCHCGLHRHPSLSLWPVLSPSKWLLGMRRPTV